MERVGAAITQAMAGKIYHFGHPSMRNLDEICPNNCLERRLEDTCFGKQRMVFMRRISGSTNRFLF